MRDASPCAPGPLTVLEIDYDNGSVVLFLDKTAIVALPNITGDPLDRPVSLAGQQLLAALSGDSGTTMSGGRRNGYALLASFSVTAQSGLLEPNSFFRLPKGETSWAELPVYRRWQMLLGLSILSSACDELGSDPSDLSMWSFSSMVTRAAWRVARSLLLDPGDPIAAGSHECLLAALRWRSVVIDQRLSARSFRRRFVIDPEQEMREILFDARNLELLSIWHRPGTLGSEQREDVVQLVEGWFLPRFDIIGAKQLLDAASQTPQGSQRLLRTNRFGPALSFWVFFIAIFAGSAGLWLGPPIAWFSAVMVVATSVVAVGLVAWKDARTRLPYANLLLPRVAAGVTVGAALFLDLPASVTKQLSGMRDFPAWAVCLLVVVVLAVSVLFLTSRLKRGVGGPDVLPTRTVWNRAILVLAIAAAQSSLASLIVMLAFGQGLAEPSVSSAVPTATFCGLVLTLLPQQHLASIGVCMLGAFVFQILWEDQHPTAPIA